MSISSSFTRGMIQGVYRLHRVFALEPFQELCRLDNIGVGR
jgi:hypothetical protein